MYKIWRLNYSLMERRATNLRHSSLLTLELRIQSSLRSQVKWVRLSQCSLYGHLLASQRHRTLLNVSGADGSRNPETKKCFTSNIASLAEISSTGSLSKAQFMSSPAFLLDASKYAPKMLLLLSQKDRLKNFGVCLSVPSSRHSFGSQQLQIYGEFPWAGNIKWPSKGTRAP